MIQSRLLSSLDWLEHGFGTRHDHPDQGKMASLRQIHSPIVVTAEQVGNCGEGDALITIRPNLGISIRTADCLPILLADAGHRAIAAIHAGWRGTSGQIVTAALKRMTEEFGTQPSEVFAAIGPGIGKCCYHVGEEVARLFGGVSAGKIDLAEANQSQLITAGVRAAQIEVIGRCSFCEAEEFYSFRREKEKAGRLISFIRWMN